MKILVLGAGVIGTTHGWQLSNAGHEVTLYVRKANLEKTQKEGFTIHCRDERQRNSVPMDVSYHPVAVSGLCAQDNYDLIIVCVKAHQLEEVLSLLSSSPAKADILFFGNNWRGNEKIREHLPVEKVLFGFSRLVGGWRTGNRIECIFFDNPELVTMLGERDGQTTPRLQNLQKIFDQANLRPVISTDILGWLAIHYVEFLGVIGGILKAGSFEVFVDSSELIKESILATQESFRICKARGIDFKKAASTNIRFIDGTPALLLTPLVKLQYRTPSIKQFFEENIEHGMDEIRHQYEEVLAEGRRLNVKMPRFEGYKKVYKPGK